MHVSFSLLYDHTHTHTFIERHPEFESFIIANFIIYLSSTTLRWVWQQSTGTCHVCDKPTTNACLSRCVRVSSMMSSYCEIRRRIISLSSHMQRWIWLLCSESDSCGGVGKWNSRIQLINSMLLFRTRSMLILCDFRPVRVYDGPVCVCARMMCICLYPFMSINNSSTNAWHAI